MAIKFARVDERLVHGQVMTAWIKQYPAEKILIIDDALAEDDFTKSVLSMSAPSGVTIDILPVKAAADQLQQDSQDVFVLFKTPLAALALIKAGAALPALNIGNMSSSPARLPLTKRVFASAEEKKAMKALAAAGVDVYLQMLPSDKRVALEALA